MKALLVSILPVEVNVDGRVHLVRRPTVLEALTVTAATAGIAEGDETAGRQLRRTLIEWMGPRVGAVLAVEPGLKTVASILSLGLPEREDEHKKNEEEVKLTAARTSWLQVVTDYAQFYGMTPRAALSEPWPFFIAAFTEIPRIRAVQQIDNAAWYAGVKTGKMDSIQRRAFGNPFAGFVTPEYMNEEWKQEQISKARRLREKQRAKKRMK